MTKPVLLLAISSAVGCACWGQASTQEVSTRQSLPQAASTTTAQTARPPLSPQEMGDIHMARKRYRDAIDSYKQAPPSAVLWNKIGIAYHQLGELSAAESAYSRAVKMDPRFTEAINNLGTVYYSRRSYRRAISQYKKVLRLKPQSAATLANLASAYFARKQYVLSQETLDQALEIDPNVLENNGGVGSIVRDSSVIDRPTYFYTLAKSYAKRGLNDRAMNYIRKALEEGFKEPEKFRQEPEFRELRNDPEFQKLLAVEPKVL